MKNRIMFLMRIGNKENIEDLQINGTVYINTIQYFREREENEQRKDIYEGIEKIDQIPWMRIVKKGDSDTEITNEEIIRNTVWEGKDGVLRLSISNMTGNIYSMMGITDQPCEKVIELDERCREFGDHLILFTNPKEFIDRVVNELNKLGLNFNWGLVKYYNEDSHSGDLDVFYKPSRYEFQKEFRFFVYYTKDEPIIIKVGSLKSISKIIDLRKNRFYFLPKNFLP